MFSHLTGQARRVFQLAHREALQRNHDYVGTEHVLFAMLKEGGTLARILANCQADARSLFDQLDEELAPSSRVLTLQKLPLTMALQRVLDTAIDEARLTHQGQAGLEHLLLGILEQSDSQAAELLERQGVTLADCRRELAGKNPSENRDHLVQTDLPAVPGVGRDPTARELEERITPEILPREWYPGLPVGLPAVDVQPIENQLLGTQLVLGALMGAFAMVAMYQWQAFFAGALIGALFAAFQNSVLGCLFGGAAGFFTTLQYVDEGPWVVVVGTSIGIFAGSFLGNVWRRPPPPQPKPPSDED